MRKIKTNENFFKMRGSRDKKNFFRMATAPKLEPIDAVNLDSRILDLLAEYPNGMFDSELREKISHIPDEQRVAAINYLLTKGKIDLIRAKNTDMIGYKLRNAETQK